MSIWLAKLAVDRWRQAEGCNEGQGADADPLVLITETAHGPRIDAANRAGLAAGAPARHHPANAPTMTPAT